MFISWFWSIYSLRGHWVIAKSCQYLSVYVLGLVITLKPNFTYRILLHLIIVPDQCFALCLP